MNQSTKTIDPIEALNECLSETWSTMCRDYDVVACLPDINALFDQVSLRDPCLAAETVLVNMLMDVEEDVSRFSPWYRQPSRAFGVTSLRDPSTNQNQRLLAPEAYVRWEKPLEKLERLFYQYRGIIQAVLLVDGLMAKSTPEDPVVTASCGCYPPHAIQVRHSVICQAEVLCEECNQPFR